MINDAGPELDRLIERKLNGDAKKKTPPYSTSEKAANRLLRRLEMQDMPCSIEDIDGVWYCTFWIVFPNCRERLSTGSGETRALAIARAVMNARLGMGASLSTGVPELATRLHWAHGGPAASEPEPICAGCGVALPSRNRETSNRFCTVCSWRAGKSKLEASNGDGHARGEIRRVSGGVSEIRIEQATAEDDSAERVTAPREKVPEEIVGRR